MTLNNTGVEARIIVNWQWSLLHYIPQKKSLISIIINELNIVREEMFQIIDKIASNSIYLGRPVSTLYIRHLSKFYTLDNGLV